MNAAGAIKLMRRGGELSITVSNRPIARETTQSRPCPGVACGGLCDARIRARM